MSEKNGTDWAFAILIICAFSLWGFHMWIKYDEKKSAAMQHYQVCECLKSAEASK